MRLHHIVEAQSFNRGMLEELFELSRRMETVVAAGGSKDALPVGVGYASVISDTVSASAAAEGSTEASAAL